MQTRQLPDRVRIALRFGAAALVVGLLVLTAHAALRFGSDSVDSLIDNWLYVALLAGAAVSCLARAALIAEERVPWAVMGVGILAWTAGEVYYTLALTELDDVPIPSPADAGYLAFYVASYVAIVLLVRVRVPAFSRALWLDGAIGAAGVAALAATVAFASMVDASADGSSAAVAVNLAYPIGDLVLLSLVVAVFGLSGWRPGRAWILLGAGLATMAVADGVYLLRAAEGTYTAGGLLDAWWPAAALLVGFAAWSPAVVRRGVEMEGLRVVVVPAACGMLALFLVAVPADIDHAGKTLSLVTLFLVTVRMALAFRTNQRLLGESRHEALTDALTGLGNRRSLLADMGRALEDAEPGEQRLVILLDLDGFKTYNDSFGHPAGDQLLRTLGRRLAAAAEPYGNAYRMGGDEFCVLAVPGAAGDRTVTAAAAAALSAQGEGFAVTASHGSVTMPAETASVSEALRVADRRMYADKGGGRSTARRQSRDVLISTLRERQPELHMHLTDVAKLAVLVGRELGMSPEHQDEVGRAAELHDVGKVAIPDAILHKPGPLTEDEWAFMRRHTLVGERIIAAAPALAPVAKLVRSSHERWDGRGYPDGLFGEQIPLGARVVAACDAYDAMVAARPYREPMTPDEALAELDRNSGTQFDPAIVAAFLAMHAEHDAARRATA